MSTITLRDGVELYYKDWGRGQPVVFSHGWPLDSDAWDVQMMFLCEHGYRCVAHDRRGHGRSTQPWDGNDMDHFADDLAELMEDLDLRDVVLVGHSMGGGDVARYVGRHGCGRLAKIVLLSAVTPLLLQTQGNPEGIPMAMFDQLRAGLRKDRSQFFKDLAAPFFGANRKGAQVSQGILDRYWFQAMRGSLKSQYDCVKAFSETDFTEDLKQFAVPALIIHGDDDQIVPMADTAVLAAKIVKDAQLKIYAGGSHGIAQVDAGQLNADLLQFIQAERRYVAIPTEGAPPVVH